MLLLLLQVCAVLEAPGGLGHCGNRLASPLTARPAGPTGVGPWSISEAQTWRLSRTVVSRVLLTTAFLMSSSHTSQRTQIPDRKLVEKGRGREWKGLNRDHAGLTVALWIFGNDLIQTSFGAGQSLVHILTQHFSSDVGKSFGLPKTRCPLLQNAGGSTGWGLEG